MNRLTLDQSGTRSIYRTSSHTTSHSSRLGPPPLNVTYGDIRAWVYSHYGFSPRTGWIAHVKELSGLKLRAAHNRRVSSRVDSSSPERRSAIQDALRHFRIL